MTAEIDILPVILVNPPPGTSALAEAFQASCEPCDWAAETRVIDGGPYSWFRAAIDRAAHNIKHHRKETDE